MSPNLGYKKEKYQCNAYSVKRSECSCKEKTDQKIKMSKKSPEGITCNAELRDKNGN